MRVSDLQQFSTVTESSKHTKSTSPHTIDARGVVKRYGRKVALAGVDLQVGRGEIVGFIGPNGSGKTTFLQIIAGLIQPDAGEVHTRIASGRDPRVGLVLEKQGLIPHLSARRNLELLGRISGGVDAALITQRMSQVGLDPTDVRKVRTWSQGMRQRLSLAQALLESPDILLLDEPTNGLDPVGVADLRKLLTEVAAQGVTVLLASHALTEVERLCTRAYFVRSGSVVEVFEMDHGPGVHVHTESPRDIERLEVWAQSQNIVVRRAASPVATMTFLATAIPSADIIAGLVSAGVRIVAVGDGARRLEQRFLELVQGGGGAA